jgi:t-SNARE complex subunit (syntaxin)
MLPKGEEFTYSKKQRRFNMWVAIGIYVAIIVFIVALACL